MRLDVYLLENRLASSRTKAQQLVKAGYVSVDGKVILKPSYELLCNETITIAEYHNYVSRGSCKLLGAIESFEIDFSGKVVLDCGASTGGFTQVALEHNAKKVYAVDVGQGELDGVLRAEPRVVNLENTDVRFLTKEQVGDSDIVVSDMSFISLKKVLPNLKNILGEKEMVLLFKPQFECGKELAKRYKGVIKNQAVHKSLLKDFVVFIRELGFKASGLSYSPLQGKSGNIEYLFYLNGKKTFPFDIDKVVSKAFEVFKS